MRFENLHFIITTEGELAQVPDTVQPLHSTGLDAITEALEELLARCLPRTPTILGGLASPHLLIR